MNRISAFLLLTCFAIGFAQAQQIKSGATVYIEPMDGYGTYLATAFMKKHVPLIVVADKDKAEYIIASTVAHKSGGQPAVVVNNMNVNNGGNDSFEKGMEQAQARRAARGTTSASISVIDAQSSQIVFAYCVGKNANTNQVQSTAEACAKHLKAKCFYRTRPQPKHPRKRSLFATNRYPALANDKLDRVETARRDFHELRRGLKHICGSHCDFV